MLYIHFTAQVDDKSIKQLILKANEAVASGEKEVTILISTPGGFVTNGLAAFNTFKMLPLKKIFWNIGNIDSIGVMLFLAGDERYCVPNSRFLLHDLAWQTGAPTSFSESNLRLNADSLAHDREAICQLSSAVTGQKAEVISDMMKKGKILNVGEAKSLGYIHEEKILNLPQNINIVTITN